MKILYATWYRIQRFPSRRNLLLVYLGHVAFLSPRGAVFKTVGLNNSTVSY